MIVGCTDKPKVAEMSKGNKRSSGRRTLADISNIPQPPSTSNQYNTPQPNIKEHIKQLQKEKAALMKLLLDKNKIIEETGAEGHKLKVTLQKIQEQNLQLAQSNNQMLVELNSGKERQKALQHELGCKNGLVIALKLELENTVRQTNGSDHHKVSKLEETQITSRRQKSKSLVPSVQKVQDNEMGNNRRLQTRRQSAMFKVNEPKPTIDSIKIENVDDDKLKENDSNSVPSSSKEEGTNGDNKPQEDRKTSVSRPVREAAKKVQSYKEVNVNMKMRRGENMMTRKSWIY